MNKQQKKVFLFADGRLIKTTFKSLKQNHGIKNISWESMHTLHRQFPDKKVMDLLKRYDIVTTIFHHDNLVYYGVTILFPHEYEKYEKQIREE